MHGFLDLLRRELNLRGGGGLSSFASIAVVSIALMVAACTAESSRSDASRADLRISAERYLESQGAESVVVYGNGIAIWDRSRQFRVSDGDLERMLEAFDKAEFEAMPANYGEGKKWLRRRVSLREGDSTKEVLQTVAGEQSKALQTLVEDILAIAKPKAAQAEGIKTLSEGFTQVAQGRLAPQVLSLTVHRKPREGKGWLFRVQEGVGSLQTWNGSAYEAPVYWKLPEERLTKLASILAAAQLEAMPGNLYAQELTELDVRVLDQRKTITARPFQGMQPTTHGERQTRFDQTFGALERLEKDVLANGGQQAGS